MAKKDMHACPRPTEGEEADGVSLRFFFVKALASGFFRIRAKKHAGTRQAE